MASVHGALNSFPALPEPVKGREYDGMLAAVALGRCIGAKVVERFKASDKS